MDKPDMKIINYRKAYYLKNKTKLMKVNREYYYRKINRIPEKDKISKHKDYHKTYYIKNRNKFLEYQKQQRFLKKGNYYIKDINPLKKKPLKEEEPISFSSNVLFINKTISLNLN